MAIAEQAGSSERTSRPDKRLAGDRGEQWLPSDLRHEENPLTTGTWAPTYQGATPPAQMEPRASQTDAGSQSREPVPRSSWLPPELSHGPAPVAASAPQVPASTGMVIPEHGDSIQRTAKADTSSASRLAEQWLAPDLRTEERSSPPDALLPAQQRRELEPESKVPTSEAGERGSREPLHRSLWLPQQLEPRQASDSKPAEPEPVSSGLDQPAAAEEPSLALGATSEDEIAREPDVAPLRDADDSASFGRRRKALEAYCRELFPIELATSAAAQILDLLTGAIHDDGVFLQTTRVAAAARLITRSAWEPGAQLSTACIETPLLLSARANGIDNASERGRLERHLDSCLMCRAAEVRIARADRAFAGILGLRLSAEQN